MLLEGRNRIERNNPIVPAELLKKILTYVDMAEKFEGRIMDAENFPELFGDERMGVCVQLIFKDNFGLEKFWNKVEQL